MSVSFLICLLSAHILGDFLLQSGRQAAEKSKRTVLLGHAGVQAALSYILLGIWSMVLVPAVVLATHGLIDLLKARTDRDTLKILVLDQTAHLMVVLLLTWAVSALRPGAEVFWATLLGPFYLKGLLLLAGFVLTVRGGSVFIARAVQPFIEQIEEKRGRTGDSAESRRGLDGGGRIIGQLERSLVFLFLLIGQPGGLGFLVAAKSIFRIAELKDPEERMEAEYIIMGTMLSFAYGIAVAAGTMYCLKAV